jgi:N,N-dimethylformamidase beta subunit-like, C-terminal
VRRISIGAALAALLFVAGAQGVAESDASGPALIGLHVSNGGSAFAGDGRLLTTISPNHDGFRDRARVVFRLDRVVTVRMTVNRTTGRLRPVYSRAYRLGPGRHVLVWAPKASREPRTYLVRLVVRDRQGRVRSYGSTSATRGREGPVVRIQGVDAAFRSLSYRPGQFAALGVRTDATELEVQLFRSGTEWQETRRADVMLGTPATEPQTIAWRWRRRLHFLRLYLPGRLETGLYFARLTASDGRVGFAPFVLRPRRLGRTAPVAVVLPTSTWEAYNFNDMNGNGWGDTWYAGPPARPATLRVWFGRPFLERGVPFHFRNYDLDFLRWLVWRHHAVEYLADSDLGRFVSGRQLRRSYRLIVFPGHTEYVTTGVYRNVRQYRRLGGHLMFLSANNFYWRVIRRGRSIVRSGRWRDLGRPEAAMIGVQFLVNDGGEHQRPFVVVGARAVPWLFRHTGVHNGSRIGRFGIEIDGRAPSSPPGTRVIAQIPHLIEGRTAQMTYYEGRNGAKVFAFGAFSMAGVATQRPFITMLDNLWARLATRGS